MNLQTRTKRKLSVFPALVNSMHEKPFCIDTLIRKVSNHYKTCKFPTGRSFSLMNRVEGHTVRCTVNTLENSEFSHLIFVDWSSKWGENVHFEFHVNSNKELLQKLLKQELI